MGKLLRSMLFIFLLCRVPCLLSQTPAVVISSYYNAASPLDEWTELLVIKDNTNMFNWKLQDNNATQTVWQPSITFSDPLFWNHMRAGTIIIIHHRVAGGSLLTTEKSTGYIEVAADDHYLLPVFTGGSFGTSPDYNGPTLNIDSTGDLLVLLDASGNFVHALGHQSASGPLYNFLPLPKLNYQGILSDGKAVYVCPGANIDEYGNLTPQDGSTWTSAGSGPNLTFGLPNTCTASATANSDYCRSLRQPAWINPTLSGVVNEGDNLVTLNWSAQVDSFPADGTEQYLILRNTSNAFGIPADGQSYLPGENIGGAVVVANIPSQTLTYVDTVSVPCPSGLYYEVFAYRYRQDVVFGNNYNPARGSAYNETSFAATHVSGVFPVPPVSATSDRNNICSNDNGNITLSATGGSGATLNWYTTSCGGTPIGSGSGSANSITLPSPVTTTTYYAGWENFCGVSACADLTVTIIPASSASLTITADHSSVCPGTVVMFTAFPIHEGNSPVYNWTINGNSVQSGSSPIYTNSLMLGDTILCWLTSSLTCVDTNPVSSSPLTLSFYALPVIDITDKPFLCAGDPTQLDAGPGFAAYLWQDGSSSRYFTATEAGIYRVTVTDSMGCSASDSVLLKNCDTLLFVPNAFIPNGDGVNDVFRVVTSLDGIVSFDMRIFNRWGEMVFESTDIHSGWNGMVNGRLAPEGSYAWTLVYKGSSQSSTFPPAISLHGTVVLIR